MVFRDTVRDGTTRLTGAKFLKDDADKLYLPKYQEYDSGWIYVGGGGTAPAFAAGTPFGGAHATPRFRRIGDIVFMEGLISGVPAAYSTIFTLPTGFRPSADIIPVGHGNGATEGHGVRVMADGRVTTGSGVTSWTSISTHFVAAGGSYTWHVIGAAGEPAFVAGWSNYGGGFQTARFAKIGDFVYLSGLVQRTTGTNTTVFALPTGYQPTDGTTHTPCAYAPGMGGPDGGVNIGGSVVSRVTGSTTGYLSLDGIRFYAGPANDPKWRKFRGGAEGWYSGGSAYGSGWPVPAIRRDGKIIHLEGLGTFSAANSSLRIPYGYAPGHLLVMSDLNSGDRRLDIMATDSDSSGQRTWNFGTGTVGFTHSWVVAEAFEGDIRWNS